MLFYFLGKLLFLLIYKKITWMLIILWVIISESKNFCHFQNNYNYIKHTQQGFKNYFQKEIQVYLIRELSFQIIRGSCKKNILASFFIVETFLLNKLFHIAHQWSCSSKRQQVLVTIQRPVWKKKKQW